MEIAAVIVVVDVVERKSFNVNFRDLIKFK